MNPLAWFYCSQFGATSEVWMYRQATGMHRLRVRVLTSEWHHRAQFPASNCEVIVVPPNLSPPKKRLPRVASRLANIVRGHFGSTPVETRWLIQQIRAERPSVILGQFGHVGLRVVPAGRAERVPLVIHFHGVDLSGLLRSRYYRASLRRALPHVARCVVVADYMREALLELGAQPSQITKIPCGVPINGFTPSTGIDDAECRFLMVGRLTEKKRPDLSVRAFGMVAAVHPQARLVVVGDGELLPKIRAIIDELQLGDRVDLVGAQPPDRVRMELARASVFIQHSVTAANGDKEGWPVALAEAAASGLPIVATTHASIPEQVGHGESGLLCDEGDWQAMGKFMQQLADDIALRRAMGAAARSRIAAYDSAVQIAALEEVLLSVAHVDKN
jgi:glycosyltransferase involved in cell wall biosynthesis